jgi:hypothetical protein
MRLKFWMIVKAIVVLVFGIGFVVIPEFVLDSFGMDLDEGGILMARLFGTAYIFKALLFWLSRNTPASERAIRVILISDVVSDAIAFVVTIIASVNGIWNALGWLAVGLYLVFGLVFAYFFFTKSKS